MLTSHEFPAPQVHDEDVVDVLTGVPWRVYDRIVRLRGDAQSPRLHYLDGTLSFTAPGRFHERTKSTIGCLVEAWCLEKDIEFETVGSWTLRDESKLAGCEPDECYIIGPGDAERPHLAIEVNATSGSIDKLEIYRRLGVDEVWIWEDASLQIYVQTDGVFALAKRGRHLPDLDVRLLASFLDRPKTSQAIREYRAALRSLPPHTA